MPKEDGAVRALVSPTRGAPEPRRCRQMVRAAREPCGDELMPSCDDYWRGDYEGRGSRSETREAVEVGLEWTKLLSCVASHEL